MQRNRTIVTLGIIAVVFLMVTIISPNFFKNIFKNIRGITQQAAVIGPVDPIHDWRFDNTSSPLSDSAASGAVNFPAAGTVTAKSTGCVVGNCVYLAPSGSTPSITTPTLTSVSVEFLFKAGPRFQTTTFFDTRSSNSSTFSAKMIWPDANTNWSANRPRFIFHTGNGGDQIVYLDGINRKDWSYYADGDWHHMVFNYTNASGGSKSFWVDGAKVAEQTSLGTAALNIGSFYFGTPDGSQTHLMNGYIDEAAMYNQVLPPELIYQHYLDTVGATGTAVHYNNVANNVTVPGTPAYTAGIRTLDYPTGHPTPSSTLTPQYQLASYPSPRYKAGNTLQPLHNFTDIGYMSGWCGNSCGGPTSSQVSTTATAIYTQLAQKYNYLVQLGWGDEPWLGVLGTLAVNHPEWKTAVKTFRHHVQGKSVQGSNGSFNAINHQGFSADHYFQNNSGNPIDINGGTVAGTPCHSYSASANLNATSCLWRPVSTYLSDYAVDGSTAKSYLEGTTWASAFRAAGKKLDYIDEDDETFPYLFTDSALALDPAVSAAKNASGLSWQEYLGQQFMNNEKAYATALLGSNVSGANTKFTEYRIEGSGINAYNYKYARQVTSQINGQYYSASDFYPTGGYGGSASAGIWNWFGWSGPWHGLKWFENARKTEIALGDNLFAPYIAAGWKGNGIDATTNNTYDEGDIRPGQWLGLLKILNVMGAEFYYTGYFDEGFSINPPVKVPADGKKYTWQLAMPAYAQAITSRFEDILRNGTLLTGANSPGSNIMPFDYDGGMGAKNPNASDGYSFASGNMNAPVMVRKSTSGNKYIIAGTLQAESNMDSPDADRVQNVTITLEGEDLKFQVRRQGSTYYYDKTNTAAPIFYQLDGWHKDAWPGSWGTDFAAEAENYDSGTTSIKTTGTGVSSRDFTPGNYDTYVDPASGTLTYKFQSPDPAASPAAKTYYLWYRALSNTGTATASFGLDSATAQQVSITNTGFAWCNKSAAGSPITFSGVTANVDHDFKFTGSSANFDFDQFILTTNASMNLGNCSGAGTSDTTAPTTPGTLSATGTTATSTNLSWGASTDNVGVTSYDIYNASTKLASSLGTNTNYALTGLTASTTYSLSIKARDAAGNTSASGNTVSVTTSSAPDTTGPSVSITSPTSGQTVTGTATMQATVTDTSGVDHIDFYTKLGSAAATIVCSDNTASGNVYSCSWNTAVGADGTYSVYAIAYDSASPSNATTTTSFNVTVSNIVTPPADTTGPTMGAISISGVTGTTISGQVTLLVTAVDNGTSGGPATGMQKVEFYRGSTLIDLDTTAATGGMPANTFGVLFNTTSLSNGNYTLKAKGYDLASPSNTTDSGTLTVTVNNVALVACNDGVDNDGDSKVDYPSDPGCTSATDTDETDVVAGQPDVIISDITLNPASPVTGQGVTFSAIVKNQGTGATPAGTTTGVLFTIDGSNSTFTWSDTYTQSIAPGASVTLTANGGINGAAWTSTSGSHTILANVDDINRYVESNDSNNTLSETFTVGAGTPTDTTGPTISISSPASGGTISGTTAINATATDTSNVDGMTIAVDGAQVATSANGSVSYSWNTASATNGSHTITVTASDASTANNSSTSSITVTVNNVVTPPTDTTAPIVKISSPANNANVSNTSATTFIATITDNVAVTQAKFFLGATSTAAKCTLASPTTAPSTYSCSFTVPSVFFGLAYSTINVQAWDARGNTATASIKVR